jgi:hypothetical protein
MATVVDVEVVVVIVVDENGLDVAAVVAKTLVERTRYFVSGRSRTHSKYVFQKFTDWCRKTQ